MGIRRYPHGFAPLIELDISALAFPVATGGIQIRIRRNLDGNAGLFDPPKPSRALPAASERVRVSIDRRYRSGGLGRDAGGCSEQRCRQRQTRQQEVPLRWFDVHGGSFSAVYSVEGAGLRSAARWREPAGG